MKSARTRHYYLLPFGCQMNLSDSERIASVLQLLGYQPAKKSPLADLFVVVACSVRQKAVDRIYGHVRNWKKSQRGKNGITILTGCVLPSDKPTLKKKFDILLDIKDLPKLPSLLAEKTDHTSSSILSADYFKIRPQYVSSFQAFVPIMTGCDQFCTYCAVPFPRGREYSRPAREILAEARALVDLGYKEITLLGQTIDKYQNPRSNEEVSTLADLLKAVAEIKGVFWLRFLTSHPNYFSDELIEEIKNNDKIGFYVHLPVQAGSNQVLQRMNRQYTREKYFDIAEKLNSELPEINFSTDCIVGFSGETEKQFEESLDLFEKVRFDMAYIAQYSPRSGTAAQKLFLDDVPARAKKKREFQLNEILKQTALAKNKKYLGKTYKVLVEKSKAQNKNWLIGKTHNFKLVQFKGKKDLISTFQNVKITSATPWALSGELVN